MLARNLDQLQGKRKRDESETHDGSRKRGRVARDGSAHIAAAIAADATAPFTPATTAIPDMTPCKVLDGAARCVYSLRKLTSGIWNWCLVVATAPDLDVGTPELAEAACFRIATRHLMQTGLVRHKQQ